MGAAAEQTTVSSKMIRLGIIGTGRIARRFVTESRHVENIVITSVYNPHADSARRFVDGIWNGDAAEGSSLETPSIHDSIYHFFEEIDAVYVASPHETHFAYVMEALFRRKHVLCEKPLCLSREEAKTAFLMAKSQKCVLMEAVKTAYCPGFGEMLLLIEDGLIGRIRYVDACFTKLAGPESRELTDTAYGGSFLELGSYVMLPMVIALGGSYTALEFESMNNPAGIDIFTKAAFRYSTALATLTCGLGVKSEGRLLIAGEKGYAVASAPWWKTSHFEVHFEDPEEVISKDCEFEGDGLRYELSCFAGRIRGREDEYNMEGCSVIMAGIMEKFLSLQGQTGEKDLR